MNKIIKLVLFFPIIILLIINIIFYNNYKYCLKCIYGYKNPECYKCSIDTIFKNYYIVNEEKTLKELVNYKKSISRFGDGEFKLMFGKNLKFQKKNKLLAQRLIEVLQSNEKGLLIGINIPIKKRYLEEKLNKFTWSRKMNKYKFIIAKLLNKKKYYSSNISRFYMHLKDKTKVSKYIKKLKKLWDKKDIIIIEGEYTRFGIGNNLLDNAKSIKRIICPSENSFNVYDKILKESKKIDKKKLILIALGPTATVLTYDLYKLGYQVIDVGHMDIEYEWYLRNTTKKIKINYKYVNEANNGRKNITNIRDKNYFKQIITTIIFNITKKKII